MASPLTPKTSTTVFTPPSSIERVEAWTVDQTADVLSATSLSSPTPARATPAKVVTLDIPLDESLLQDPPPRQRSEPVHTVYKRRQPIRRDSLNRREALLKGKEGSRQRRRWENDRLLNNPYAQPPLPEDWMVAPTHNRQSVPYFLAPLWDAEYARASQERKTRAQNAKKPATKEEATAERVRQELRAQLKRARGTKGLLQSLEEEVRGFVAAWEAKERELERDGVFEPDSEDDEEIVFVGRNGTMSDEKREAENLRKDKLVFESLIGDHGASFGRYLVHAIAQYYGLKTWSVNTSGSPALRQAYVGLKTDPKTRRPSLTKSGLPRPLWAAATERESMCNQATVAAPGRLSALACETLTSSTIFHHLIVFALICRLGLLPCAINFDLCNPFPKPADIATSFSHRAKTYTGYRTTEESQNTQDISEKNKCIKMCQLCAIKTVTARDRWPKPLDHHKADVDFLVTTAHEEHDKTQAPATKENKSSKIIPASDELLDVLRMLNTLLATIEEDREAWWTSPAKRQMRKELELTCNQTKLSELHKVNNRVVEGLEGMEAKLGGFVKWGLGMNGGIWELVGSERVDCGGKEKLEGGSKVEVEVKKEKLAA